MGFEAAGDMRMASVGFSASGDTIGNTLAGNKLYK
jgi:hypothetical protein